MSDKTLQDLKVDAHIAVLHTKVDALIEKQKELTGRVRANEKVVAAIGLLGSIALAFIGAGYFAPKADGSEAAVPSHIHANIDGVGHKKSGREYPGYLEPRGLQPYPGMLSGPAAGANEWISKMRQWELEQNMRDPEFDINNALAEYFNNGGDDTTKQEELLQFSSNGDQQSIGWRYDRRDHRSGFRPLQKGTSQDSWSGYSGEED